MLDVPTFRSWIEKVLELTQIPGLAIAVLEDREVAYTGGFGVTSLEDGALPVTPQTLFRIGSLTKLITATLVMRLVQEGVVDLDAPVCNYISWLTLSEPEAARQITLQLLLSHTSGLTSDARPWGDRYPHALEEYVRNGISGYPLAARPGARFQYSNPGFSLAGYVAEAVTGKPYTDLVSEWVFGPLQMQRSTFDPLVAMTYPLAQGHRVAGDGSLRVDHRFVDNPAHYPAGFAMSTVLDLANFAAMHLQGGEFRGMPVLSRALVDLMHTARADTEDRDVRCALPFMVRRSHGQRCLFHDGAVPHFRAELALLPECGAGIVLVWNAAVDGPEVLIRAIFGHLVGRDA